MRNANGAGCVSKASEKRRKPWKVIITTGIEYDETKDRVIQKRKLLGYYRTRTEAQDALSTYRQNPYDIELKKLTFSEVYERWSNVHYEKISSIRAKCYAAAYNHLKQLWNMEFSDIRPYHIEKCMSECEAGSDTKNGIKTLCSLMYKYAIKSEIAAVNYAAMCDSAAKDSPKIIRSVIKKEEESLLWKAQGDLIADMVLIGLYSGWRPGELCQLSTEQINLSEWTMQGGIKTKAGINRIVPIHDKIKPIIERRMKEDYLFCYSGRKINYKIYHDAFIKLFSAMNTRHTPHDTRHTFITWGKECGMDDNILKIIVGHSISDVTEKTYTHRTIDSLRKELEKIH